MSCHPKLTELLRLWLMGKKPDSGTADAGAAVTWPDAEVAIGLGLELADGSLVFKSLDARFLKLVDCFLTERPP